MNEDEIRKLITLKQEGSYWDFKREWYKKEKKEDLLHDIICMANNLSNRDAYIIIGVDEESDYSICSVENDSNRRNTQQLVDFLKDKHFAGGYRPIASVESLFIDNCIIDVIVIHNDNSTPYYLTERYNSVNANNIYTRIMDSNTPKNRSADIVQIEQLWKKRFGLLTSPFERMVIYLKDGELWDESPSDCGIEKKYYRFAPEFTIEKERIDDADAYQFYVFNQTNIKHSWYNINLYYHQTMLASLEGVSLDSGRYFTPTPKTDGISLTKYHKWDISFKYFVKNSISHIIQNFYYHPDGDDRTIAYRKFMECILLFESDSEKDEFKCFAIENWCNKSEYENNIYIPYFEEIEGYNMDAFKEEYVNSQILQKMLQRFRNTKKGDETYG